MSVLQEVESIIKVASSSPDDEITKKFVIFILECEGVQYVYSTNAFVSSILLTGFF
jgi:hypothetical protein